MISYVATAAGTAPSPFPLLSRLPSLLPAAAAAAAGIFAIAIGIAVLAGGHGRPLLPMNRRVAWRLWPGPGFARSRVTLRCASGLPAARRVARRGRPSLTARDRLLGPWQEYASFAGWAHGWLWPPRIYTHLEQVRLVISPPQKGKSAAAAGSIIDAPGPVVATSIRGDLIGATASLRAQKGRIHIFNPEGAGGYASTVTWNPVAGCQDMTTAARRAGYLIEGVTARGLDDGSFWKDQASIVLAAYLHAAGLAGGTMHDVYRWILDEDQQPAAILGVHPGAARSALREIGAYLALPDRTRAGVATTIRAALRFMQDPQIADMLCPRGPGNFDPHAFVRTRDTLYLVAADAKHTPVPPVFTMLIAEIMYAARTAAGAVGRLDPPVCLELDEVANVAPVPVAAWATWAAGSGVRMHIYAQSYAQLAERWGDRGAETIWQSADAKIIYCGSSEDRLCQLVERACGQVRIRGGADVSSGPDGRQRRGHTWVTEQVLPYAMLLQLPRGWAVVIAGGCKPVLVRTEQYWRRADVLRLARRGARLILAPATPRPVPQVMPELLDPAPGPHGYPLDELSARRAARHAAGPPPEGFPGAEPWQAAGGGWAAWPPDTEDRREW